MKEPTNLLEVFLGNWCVERQINTLGRTDGKASFTLFSAKSKNILKYEESGIFFNTSGKSFKVSQSLLFENITSKTSQESSWQVWKTAPVESLLHTLYFQSTGKDNFPKVAEDTHVCSKDSYNARFTIINPVNIEIYYKVLGPKKDYHSICVLKKIV
jgi:hypothetical protein